MQGIYIIYLKQTMFIWYTVLQLYNSYNLRYCNATPHAARSVPLR
jgi:hypothetical protein